MGIGVEIYNLVVEILGPLPMEMNFLYALGTIILFTVIIACCCVPFLIMYKLWS